MALKINFEIGHEASLRTKRTPEGFTHDWKIFVRGVDGAEIHHFIEKVVFFLHETFPKPKRVIKEPPYIVKESGYAGFNLPIDIHLRNSGEPKKIKFNYDLHLQPSGPPFFNVQKEKYIFDTVLEDFKQKLLRGGAETTNLQESTENKSILYEEKNQLFNKPKYSGVEVPPKKPKLDMQVSNSFQDVFGTPIKTTKCPELKQQPPKENKISTKMDRDKATEKVKSKHSPHKDREKDKDREKFEKRTKDERKKDKEKRDKDRERSKEKSFKKEKSPRPKSPSPKHSPPKHSSLSPPPQHNVKQREKEIKEKDKKEKLDKDEKKAKKDRKDHNKDKEKHRESSKLDHKNKDSKVRETNINSSKEHVVSPLSIPALPPSPPKPEKKEKLKDDDKPKGDRTDKTEDKRHKHKKKDKSKKERKEREDKLHKTLKKVEKDKSMAPPLTGLSQSSSLSFNGSEAVTGKDNLFGGSPKLESNSLNLSPKEKEKNIKLNKVFTNYPDQQSDSSSTSRDPSPVPEAKKKEKLRKSEKRTNRDSNKKDEKRKKRKLSTDLEHPLEKASQEQLLNNDVNSDTKPVIRPITRPTHPPDYMILLRELQNKIMAIKDNADLQKVVEMIAETGQYEISAHTFDFDLCLLDRATVKQLQDFFATS